MAGVLRTARDDIAYAGVRTLLAAASPAPLRALRGVGRWLGRAAFLFPGRSRGRARQHLAAAFPEQSRAWQDGVLRRHAGHLGALLGEVAWLWSASPAAILARTEFVGLEHLTDAMAAGRGALLVTGHCGNWEWLNLGLGARGVPLTIAVREVYDPRLDEVARRLRGRFGGVSAMRGHGAGARLAEALRLGRGIGLLIDQDIDAPGAFVEFFGRPAWTPTGAAVLALRSGCPVVTGFAARAADGTMRLAFDPPLPAPDSGDASDDAALLTAQLTARIERQIRSYPEQWVWMHKRWRRHPQPGEPVWGASAPRRDASGPATVG